MPGARDNERPGVSPVNCEDGYNLHNAERIRFERTTSS